MNVKLKGHGKKAEEIIERLPMNLREYIKRFGTNPESIKKRDEFVNDKVKFYKGKGYSEDEIEVSEEHRVFFGEESVEIQKKVIISTFHTQFSTLYQTVNLYYIDVDYSKERNLIGQGIKNIVEEVFEEEQENKEEDKD